MQTWQFCDCHVFSLCSGILDYEELGGKDGQEGGKNGEDGEVLREDSGDVGEEYNGWRSSLTGEGGGSITECQRGIHGPPHVYVLAVLSDCFCSSVRR